MFRLCIMSGLSSAEWAAWVQAIGSIAAIFGAILVAGWQARRQYTDALRLMAEEGRRSRIELAKTLLVLCQNSYAVLTDLTRRAQDREAVHLIAEGETHFDLGELRRVESSLASIPLHGLPSSLVSPTMAATATVRQYREKIEQALRMHRSMDAAQFADFFRCRQEMTDSLHGTCDDIAKELNKLVGAETAA